MRDAQSIESGPGLDVLELIHESIFVRDLDGRIRYWNSACTALYGWPAEQALGQLAHELLGSAHPDGLAALEEQVTATGRWDGELCRVTASGQPVLIDARWSVHKNPRGQALGIVEIGRDISARKAIEQSLADSEYRYRNLFQAMAASFWELDFTPVGGMVRQLFAAGVTDLAAHFAEHPQLVREMMRRTQVMDVNEQTVRLFGRDNKAELLQSVEPFWPEASSEVFAQSIVAAVSRQQHYAKETRLRTIEGREFDALFTASFPPENMKKGILMVGVIDLSERNHAFAALERMQAELMHAARVSMLGELTASIAHEINQPLAAIVTNGAAGLRWLNRPMPNTEEVRTLAERMVADARRAADIIARIRDMARHQAPQQAPQLLNNVVKEAVQFLRHELQAQGVEVRLKLTANLPRVQADRTLLQQVIVNLLVNAMQAMADSPQRLIMVSSRAGTDGRVELRVQDSGPGIAEDHLPRLFESFFTTKASGMGMGLPICRTIVEGLGGTIEARNDEGAGACFIVSLG
ncbi:PAS domain-containing sensor histidine kinase [Pseudomonas turukhanskensis]|uniref:histidine kinase n=1 Tax=Pseudomonas turukhanskensis TaxID=1806536 RepID=A0A9W6K7Q5_9PSED|nr:ATP-binding protein [Pseudomonas turukhanskensis]GLK88999.1 PAS domain-containing sensor histidine kinase [Pseudomonas turukhanskensis]